MSAPERGPLQNALAAAWTVLLIAVILWAALYVFEMVWVWLLGLALMGGTVWALVWWWRTRRDRW